VTPREKKKKKKTTTVAHDSVSSQNNKDRNQNAIKVYIKWVFGGYKFVTIILMVQNCYKYDFDVICNRTHKHIASFLSPRNFFCAILHKGLSCTVTFWDLLYLGDYFVLYPSHLKVDKISFKDIIITIEP